MPLPVPGRDRILFERQGRTMRGTVIRQTVMVLVFLGWARPAFAAELAEMMPADTLMYVSWPGYEAFNKNCEDTAYGKIMREPQVQRFREAWNESIWPALRKKMKESVGEDEPAVAKVFDPVLTLLSGAWRYPTALGLVSVTMSESMPVVDAALIIRAGREAPQLAAAVDHLLEAMGPEAGEGEAKEIAVNGGKLKQGVVPAVEWVHAHGVVGDDLIVTLGRRTLEHLNAGAAVKGLAASERFQAAMKVTGGSAGTPVFYLDLAGVVKTVESFQPVFAEMPIIGEEGGIQRVLKSLGLDTLQSVSAAGVPEAGGFKTTGFLHAPGIGQNASAMFAQKPLTDEDLRLVPKQAEWAAVTNFDLAGFYRGIMTSLKDLSPELHEQASGGIEAFEGQLGISIVEDVLGTFQDTWAVYDAPENGGLFITGMTLVAEVKKDNHLDHAMEAIVGLIAGLSGGGKTVALKQEQYREHTIHYVSCSGIPVPVAPAWSQHEDRWILALYPQMVRITLDRMIDRSESILDNADFQRGRKQLPAQLSSLSYVDTVAAARQIYALLLPVTQAVGAMAQGEDIPLDGSLLPALPPVLKHLFGDVSGTTHTDQGVMTVVHGPLPVAMPTMGAANGALLGIFAGGISIPSLSRARDLSKRSVSAANLRAIGLALHSYALQHDEKLPPNLQVLVDEGAISGATLISPLASSDEESSYIYLPVESLGDLGSEDVLAYEDPGNYDGEGTHVLFGDAHVEFLDQQRFEEAIERTQERLKAPKQSLAKPSKSAAEKPRKKADGANVAEVRATQALISRRGPLAAQIALFRRHVGRYPRDLDELIEKPANEADRAKWAGPYIADVESLEDAWGNPLIYEPIGTGDDQEYELWSAGPDGKKGTRDDVRE